MQERVKDAAIPIPHAGVSRFSLRKTVPGNIFCFPDSLALEKVVTTDMFLALVTSPPQQTQRSLSPHVANDRTTIASTTKHPHPLFVFPLFINTNWQFLLELDKPLGASGNHALAGRYATMLKSAPDFDYTFTKARAGLNLFFLQLSTAVKFNLEMTQTLEHSSGLLGLSTLGRGVPVELSSTKYLEVKTSVDLSRSSARQSSPMRSTPASSMPHTTKLLS